MPLPRLAPSAARPNEWTIPASTSMPISRDWATLQPEIERLYLHEHRKLRHIMQYMEMTYGFKASEQMYKKRFAKWGTQKNTRRLLSAQASTNTACRTSNTVDGVGAVPMSPDLSNDDRLKFSFLTSVRVWSISFYETVQSNERTSAPTRQSGPEQSQEVTFALKLVTELLSRGHGSLAGRLARKAFLLVEEILMLEGPALMWNMFEVMHHMVMSNQLQLFRLLLSHLMALLDDRMSTDHPLPTMLRALGLLFVGNVQDSMSNRGGCNPTSCSSCPPFVGNKATTAAESRPFSGHFLATVCQAWTLNAEILFEKFDYRLFQLYSRIHWDSCSIDPPKAIFGAAKRWLDLTTSQQIPRSTAEASQSEDLVQIKVFEDDRILQGLFAAPPVASPPQICEVSCVSSITVLRDFATSILSKGTSTASDASRVLRILAGLVSAKVLDGRPLINSPYEAGADMTPKMSRGQAGNLASAIRTSMDLNAERNGLEAISDTVGQARAIVSLREYASARTDPRVVQEMWLLQAALVVAGRNEEALEVEQTAYRRIEEYVQDIAESTA